MNRWYGVFFILCAGLFLSCQSEQIHTDLPVKGDAIVISIDNLPDEKPEFFSITLDDRRINFFVVKTDDSVESYLDACMKCYPHQMGYRVDEQVIECRYCSVRYPVDSLKTGVGGCYPIPLHGNLQENEYTIRIEDFKKLEKYF